MQQVVASEGRMGPLALWVASFRVGAEVGEEVCPMLGSRCAAGGDVLDPSSVWVLGTCGGLAGAGSQ